MGQCYSTSSLTHAHPCSLSITVTHIPPTNELESTFHKSDKSDRVAGCLRKVPQSSCHPLRSENPLRAHYAHVAISDQRTGPNFTSRSKKLSRSALLHLDTSIPGPGRVSPIGTCERLMVPLNSMKNHYRAINRSCPSHPYKISHPKQLQPRLCPPSDCILIDDHIRRAVALPLPLNHLERPCSSTAKLPRGHKEYCVVKTGSSVSTRSQFKFSDLEMRYERAVEYISTLATRKRKNDDPGDGWLWIQ